MEKLCPETVYVFPFFFVTRRLIGLGERKLRKEIRTPKALLFH